MSETNDSNIGNSENIDYMTDSRPIAVGENTPGCKKRDPIVVAEDVTRSFGGINAVDVEYLEIPRHKITALIGPNGAGKTTLFNLLTGFDTPTPGSGSSKATALPVFPPTKWHAWAWSGPSSSPRSWAS